MGMAGGGLMSIPVPDAMFDEPDNGGYANGGMVAFAAGDSVSGLRAKWEKIIRDPQASKADKEAVFSQLKQAQQETYSTPSLISEVPNVFNALRKDTSTPLNVVPGSYPGAPTSAPVFAPRAAPGNTAGIDPDLDNPATYGQPYKINPPAAAPVTARPTAPRMGVPTAPVAPVAPTATTATGDGLDEYNKMLKGGYADRDAAVTDIKKLMGADDARPATDALREANKKTLSPEEQKKDKEQDMWMTLAQIGAGMAATKSPNFMQAVGESMQAALPGMIADRKARKAEVKDALKEQAALEGMDRQEAREYAKMGLEEYNRHSDILMKAQDLADNKEYRKAALVLQRYEAESTTRYQQGSLSVQRAALSKPTAEEADQALYNRDPTAYQKRYTAQYAGRGAAANPFGNRLGTGGGGGTDPYAGFSVVGQ